MDFTAEKRLSNCQPSSEFKSSIRAGLLNPMSPPPDSSRSTNPSVYEMMNSEPDTHPRFNNAQIQVPISASRKHQSSPVIDEQAMQRIWNLLSTQSPGNQFNDPCSSDTKLMLRSKCGTSVSINVHRQILVMNSRFFAVKLSNRWIKQQKNESNGPLIVEIDKFDGMEIYIETLRLMYCKDLKKELTRVDVSKVLEILKISFAIGFDGGIVSCLEYLKAAPWDEEEEEKVVSLLTELRLDSVGACRRVLKRVNIEVTKGTNP